MAIESGMDCMQCEKVTARRDSHFCSEACRDDFMTAVDGPVACDGSRYTACWAQCDTMTEAKAAGWKNIEEAPEGVTWNYSGLCPKCQKEGENADHDQEF